MSTRANDRNRKLVGPYASRMTGLRNGPPRMVRACENAGCPSRKATRVRKRQSPPGRAHDTRRSNAAASRKGPHCRRRGIRLAQSVVGLDRPRGRLVECPQRGGDAASAGNGGAAGQGGHAGEFGLQSGQGLVPVVEASGFCARAPVRVGGGVLGGLELVTRSCECVLVGRDRLRQLRRS